MTTEFDIGDEVWYGYPEQEKGTVTRIIIDEKGVQYEVNKKDFWEIVGISAKDAKIRIIKSELAYYKSRIEKLKKELEELEK